MEKNQKQILLDTIIYGHDFDTGKPFNLAGREFVLKEKSPRFCEAEDMNGGKVTGEYWVITLYEFLRVVPEAEFVIKIDSDEILIPVEKAIPSQRPYYIKSKPKPLV